MEKESEEVSKIDNELINLEKKMKEAANAICNMSKKSIAALKALKKETPSTRIPLRLSAIIYYKVAKKKVKEKCDWNETKNAIMKEDFISTITNLKFEDLGPKVINILKQEIREPDWNIEKTKGAFYEVGLLAEWIESIISYAEMYSTKNDNNKKKENKNLNDMNKNEEKEPEEIKSEKEHELISFGKMMQNKTNLLKKLDDFKKIKEKFIGNIKGIMNRLNLIIKNVELLYKINEEIIKNEPKFKNYEILHNINENNIDDYFKNLEEINEYNDLNFQLMSMMTIYDDITKDNDCIKALYNIDKTKDVIKILNGDFVKKNIDKCKIIYENKEYKLTEFFDVKNIKTNKLEIKIKDIKEINLKGMFYNCPSLFSLPNISKWNKNININKDLLTKEKNKYIINKNEVSLKDVSDSINIIFVGGSGCGKTSLITRLIYDEFKENECRTNGIESHTKLLEIFNKKLKLTIFDIKGDQKSAPLSENYIKTCDGIIFVLDIKDNNSLEELERNNYLNYWKERKKNSGSIILANKCDLKEKRELTKMI